MFRVTNRLGFAPSRLWLFAVTLTMSLVGVSLSPICPDLSMKTEMMCEGHANQTPSKSPRTSCMAKCVVSLPDLRFGIAGEIGVEAPVWQVAIRRLVSVVLGPIPPPPRHPSLLQ